jgi:oxygen-independent coproporphyrinogen-3 oxidase
MAGIYIHIPFCKQACHYCNFHFSTGTGNRDAMVNAIVKEIQIRKHTLSSPIETIYFGGGTPSILDASLLMLSYSQSINITESVQIRK